MPTLEYVNKLVYSKRAHWNTWGRVSQAWKRVQKRDNEVWTLHNIWDLWHGCRWMCRWTMAVLLHVHSGSSTEILEQTIVTSLYDVTRVSHATVGGNYKRRLWLSLRGCYYCHLGVLTQEFGSLISHRPSNLAVLVPLEYEAYPECTVLFVFP